MLRRHLLFDGFLLNVGILLFLSSASYRLEVFHSAVSAIVGNGIASPLGEAVDGIVKLHRDAAARPIDENDRTALSIEIIVTVAVRRMVLHAITD